MSLLDFDGFIDDVFESMKGTRTYDDGDYDDDGIWEESLIEDEKTYSVNVQPLSTKDIKFLEEGGERIDDTRAIHVNGSSDDFSNGDLWSFSKLDGNYRCAKMDNRPWRNFCKFYAIRLDE